MSQLGIVYALLGAAVAVFLAFFRVHRDCTD